MSVDLSGVERALRRLDTGYVVAFTAASAQMRDRAVGAGEPALAALWQELALVGASARDWHAGIEVRFWDLASDALGFGSSDGVIEDGYDGG